MRTLIIDKDAIEAIQKVISYAEAHKVSINQLKEIVAGKKLPAGDDPGHVCFFNDGFRAVYSIEEQPQGWFRHLSVSIEAFKTPSKEAMTTLVSEEAITMIMTEFGLKYPFKDSTIWIEEDVLTPGGLNVAAVNILQLYE